MSNDCADAQQEAIDDTTYPCSSFAVEYDDSDSTAWALMVSTTPLKPTANEENENAVGECWGCQPSPTERSFRWHVLVPNV
jgi:hypothetical protein